MNRTLSLVLLGLMTGTLMAQEYEHLLLVF